MSQTGESFLETIFNVPCTLIFYRIEKTFKTNKDQNIKQMQQYCR